MITGVSLRFAKLPQNLKAIEHWQHHIQNDQIECAVDGARQSPPPIMRRIDLKTLLREVIPHQAAQVRVVLNEQNRSRSPFPVWHFRPASFLAQTRGLANAAFTKLKSGNGCHTFYWNLWKPALYFVNLKLYRAASSSVVFGITRFCRSPRIFVSAASLSNRPEPSKVPWWIARCGNSRSLH